MPATKRSVETSSATRPPPTTALKDKKGANPNERTSPTVGKERSYQSRVEDLLQSSKDQSSDFEVIKASAHDFGYR